MWIILVIVLVVVLSLIFQGKVPEQQTAMGMIVRAMFVLFDLIFLATAGMYVHKVELMDKHLDDADCIFGHQWFPTKEVNFTNVQDTERGQLVCDDKKDYAGQFAASSLTVVFASLVVIGTIISFVSRDTYEKLNRGVANIVSTGKMMEAVMGSKTAYAAMFEN